MQDFGIDELHDIDLFHLQPSISVCLYLIDTRMAVDLG